MNRIHREAQWLSKLALGRKILFIALLSHQITIAGRASYVAGTDDLSNPRLLRKINEAQHRLTSDLCHLLEDTRFDGFEMLLVSRLFARTDAELQALLECCWEQAKMHLETDERD